MRVDQLSQLQQAFANCSTSVEVVIVVLPPTSPIHQINLPICRVVAAAAAVASSSLASSDNAFTAGVLTSQQIQYAASMGRHPTDVLAGSSKLLTLHEHSQQQHTGLNGSPAAAGSHPQHQHQHQQLSHGGSSGHGSGGNNHAAAPKIGSGAASKLRQRSQKFKDWLQHGREDSWRQQQEQLQQDKYTINQVGELTTDDALVPSIYVINPRLVCTNITQRGLTW